MAIPPTKLSTDSAEIIRIKIIRTLQGSDDFFYPDTHVPMPESCLAALWPTRAGVGRGCDCRFFMCVPGGAVVGIVTGRASCGVGMGILLAGLGEGGICSVGGPVGGGSGFWRWEMGEIRQKKLIFIAL